MKYIFGICLACLLLAGGLTYELMPESKSKVPILYWVTDPNPARVLQIATFKSWLEKNGYPECEIRIDAANKDAAKTVIQSVSGVAGDIIDLGGILIDFYTSVGLLEDITDSAKKLGFAPDKTYPAIQDEITVEGRQFTFPCNVGGAPLYWINKATFKKYGQPIPPPRWTVAEFEKAGRAFVEKANEGKKRRDVFFVDGIGEALLNSTGMDTFNETLTACTLDDPRYVKVLKLLYKWTYEDHLIPTSSECSSFDTESGYGGSTLQMFNNGNYAMVLNGRHALIQFRKFGRMSLALTEPPYFEYPVTRIRTRAAGIYAAGKNRDLAKYFLAYLASEGYNMNIIADADGLPPNPEFTKREEFLHPRDYPNEWGCHEMFLRAALDISVTASRSPFVLPTTCSSHIGFYEGMFMNDRATAEEAARQVTDRINGEIKRSLRDNPKLQPLFNQRVQIQKKIEGYRREWKKVPPSWLFNPFYRKYYRDMGWIEAESK